MGPFTTLHPHKVLNEKSIEVYKSKNIISCDDLLKVKEEVYEENKRVTVAKISWTKSKKKFMKKIKKSRQKKSHQKSQGCDWIRREWFWSRKSSTHLSLLPSSWEEETNQYNQSNKTFQRAYQTSTNPSYYLAKCYQTLRLWGKKHHVPWIRIALDRS